MKWYFTYVLQSKKGAKLYVGWTFNLKDRIKKHNEGKVAATQNRRPLELIYFEARKNKDQAIAREKYLKSGFGRRYLKDTLEGYIKLDKALIPGSSMVERVAVNFRFSEN